MFEAEEDKRKLPFSVRSQQKFSPGRFAVSHGIKSPFLIPFIMICAIVPIYLIIGMGWLFAYAIKSSLKLGHAGFSEGVIVSSLIFILTWLITKTKLGKKLKIWTKAVSSDEITFDIDSFTCSKGTQSKQIYYSQLGSIDYDSKNPWSEIGDLLKTLKTAPREQRKEIAKEMRNKTKEARNVSTSRHETSLTFKDLNGKELFSLDTDLFDTDDIQTILTQLSKQAPKAKLNRDAQIETDKFHKTEDVLKNVTISDEDRKTVLDLFAKSKSWRAIKYLQESKNLSYHEAHALAKKIRDQSG